MEKYCVKHALGKIIGVLPTGGTVYLVDGADPKDMICANVGDFFMFPYRIGYDGFSISVLIGQKQYATGYQHITPYF